MATPDKSDPQNNDGNPPLNADLDNIVKKLLSNIATNPPAKPPQASAETETASGEPAPSRENLVAAEPPEDADTRDFLMAAPAAPLREVLAADPDEETLRQMQEDFPALFASTSLTAASMPAKKGSPEHLQRLLEETRAEFKGGVPEHYGPKQLLVLSSLLCSVIASLSGNMPAGLGQIVAAAVLDPQNKVLAGTTVYNSDNEQVDSPGGARDAVMDLLRNAPQEDQDHILHLATNMSKHAVLTADAATAESRHPLHTPLGLNINSFMMLLDLTGSVPTKDLDPETMTQWAKAIVELFTITARASGAEPTPFGTDKMFDGVIEYMSMRKEHGTCLILSPEGAITAIPEDLVKGFQETLKEVNHRTQD